MKCNLKGGPFDGQTLNLNHPNSGTLEFKKVGHKPGRYINFDGKTLYWKESEECNIVQPVTTTSAPGTES